MLAAPVDPGLRLRLVSLNTWKCDGAYPRRLQLMANQLRALAPDLVALQESFRGVDGSHDTARDLARSLGMHWATEPARRKVREFDGRRMDSHSGLALLSRYAPLHSRAFNLPSSVADGGRLAQICTLEAAGHTVLIANAHLSHLAQPGLRERQLRALLDEPRLQAGVELALVCGDFNSALRGTVLQQFVTAPWPWRDAFGTDKCTYLDADGGAHDIDHVLLRQDAKVRCLAARVVLNQPEDGLLPSDHFGVCVDLCIGHT